VSAGKLPYQITRNCDQVKYIQINAKPTRIAARSRATDFIVSTGSANAATTASAAMPPYTFAVNAYAGNSVLTHPGSRRINTSMAITLKPTA